MEKYKTMEQLKVVLDFFEKEKDLKFLVKLKTKDKLTDKIVLTSSTFMSLFGSAKMYNPYIWADDGNIGIEVSIDI